MIRVSDYYARIGRLSIYTVTQNTYCSCILFSRELSKDWSPIEY